MKYLLLALLFAFNALSADSLRAQSLTVQLVSESYAPLKHVPVAIRYNFRENRTARRDEVISVRTDAAGNATFANLHLNQGGFSVLAGGMCDVAEATPIFLLPDDPDAQPGKTNLMNPVFTALPSTIHVVVRQRSFGECLRWVLSGGG